MIRRWKTKNKSATGIVISVDAASLSGKRFPTPSWPDASCATPFVSVLRLVLCAEMMKCASSFHDPWNARMKIVIERGPRHRQHDRPVDAEDAGAVDPGGLLDARGDRLEEVLHDEDAGGVDEERDDHPVVRVVDPELADHQELRDQEHDAGNGHHSHDRREGRAAPAEAQTCERIAGEAVEEDPKERDAERDDRASS